MTFDTAKLQAQHYATLASNYAQYGRDEGLAFLSNNLPNTVTEKFTETAKAINESIFAQHLENFETTITTPANLSSALLGAGAGCLLIAGKPILAVTCLLPAVALTKNEAEISVLGVSLLTGVIAGGVISLFNRANIITSATTA